MKSSLEGKLQMPHKPPLDFTIRAENKGQFKINTTLDYQFGTTHIFGNGAFFPDVKGQTSDFRTSATLQNDNGIVFSVFWSTDGTLNGTVSHNGLMVGEVENRSGLGPRVMFTGGTFVSLF